jgi:indolepyruvate ferredoxin oxidoreductase beta subunit
MDTVKGLLEAMFRKGGHVTTMSVRWFLLLWLLARITGRFALIPHLGQTNLGAATAFAECQSQIKGYSETFERGLRQYDLISAAIARHRQNPYLARHITALRDAALVHACDIALNAALAALDPDPSPTRTW